MSETSLSLSLSLSLLRASFCCNRVIGLDELGGQFVHALKHLSVAVVVAAPVDV